MKRRRRLLALLLATALPAAQAYDQPDLFWAFPSAPGLVQLDDQGVPSAGPLVEMMKAITAQMPERQHHFLTRPLPRSLHELPRRSDLCVVAVLRTAERDRLGAFVGTFISLPPKLVIRASDQSRLAVGGAPVSLAALVANPNLHSAVQADRAYGPGLDGLLQAGISAGRIQRMNTSDAGANLVLMLDRKRIDYLLEFPMRINASLKSGMTVEPLLLLPVSEALNPQISGIYCASTPAGQALVRQIDQIVRQPALLAFSRQLFDLTNPANERAEHSAWIEEYFRSRPQRSLTNLED